MQLFIQFVFGSAPRVANGESKQKLNMIVMMFTAVFAD
jgi:hypothetical protein